MKIKNYESKSKEIDKSNSQKSGYKTISGDQLKEKILNKEIPL